jgi:anaerobic ribonucleoside-triphosphate reductase activating protein
MWMNPPLTVRLLAVVWVQGCSRECRGCFNQASWSFEINQLITVESLAAKILANPRNSGLTFSGGEPFGKQKP